MERGLSNMATLAGSRLPAHAAGGGRLFGLDFLRAMAILMVLCAHAQALTTEHMKWMRHLSVGGMLGVEIFFVLSGYLIGAQLLALGSSLSDRRELLTFYQRRWLRTIPNFILFLVIHQLLWSLSDRKTPPLALYLGFVQSWAWEHPPFFPEAWSLAIEEWFYLLIPALIFLLLKRGLPTLTAFTAASLCFLILPLLLRLLSVMLWDLDWEKGIRQTTILRLDAIMYGMLAVAFQKRFPNAWLRLRWPGLLVGLAIITGLIFCYQVVDLDQSVFARTWLFSLLPLGVALLLPYSCGIAQPKNRVLLCGVERTAAWSYSLYMANLPIVSLLFLVGLAQPMRQLEWATPLLVALFFTLSFLLSWATYTWCERPFLRWRSKVAKHRVTLN